MKHLIATTYIILVCSVAFCQDQLRVDVFPNNYTPVFEWELPKAEMIRDIQAGYPADWIREDEYISTRLTLQSKEVLVAEGKNEFFSQSQKALLAQASLGDQIIIDVTYKEENAAKNQTDNRHLSFELSVVPDSKALFPGGESALNNYLQEHIIKKLPVHEKSDLEIASFVFTVDKNGNIGDIQVKEFCPLMQVQILIMEAINSMPRWESAKDKIGESVPQEFQLRIGYMVGC